MVVPVEMKVEYDEGAELTPMLEKVEVVPHLHQVGLSQLMETDERRKWKWNGHA